MMQRAAVEIVKEKILNDALAEAIFLKGSLARAESDQWSDVDFYVLVKPENHTAFLAKRLDYLRAYRSLLYWSEENFVAPQIVAVFDNGLHFDLYTVTATSLPTTDCIEVLYDPQGLLADYHELPLAISAQEAAVLINEFSFIMMEWNTARQRQDWLLATRYFHHAFGYLAKLQRFLLQPEKAQLGCKRLLPLLQEERADLLRNTLASLTPNRLCDGAKAVYTWADLLCSELPPAVTAAANQEFYRFIRNQCL